MPPPTQNPCRVCACWAKAEVASRAVSIAQNPVARSVPISPLEVGERAAVAGVIAAGVGTRCEGKLHTRFAVPAKQLWRKREAISLKASVEAVPNFFGRFAEPTGCLRYPFPPA